MKANDVRFWRRPKICSLNRRCRQYAMLPGKQGSCGIMQPFLFSFEVLTSFPVAAAEGTEMLHDDVVGEEITPEEEYNIKASIVAAVSGRDWEDGADLRFPGSQPVSLARSNLDMLNTKRYWVTWKVGFPLSIRLGPLAALWTIAPMDMTQTSIIQSVSQMRTRNVNLSLAPQLFFAALLACPV